MRRDRAHTGFSERIDTILNSAKLENTHTHARKHMQAHTHTQMQTHTHTHKCTHTHTHSHTLSLSHTHTHTHTLSLSFSLQGACVTDAVNVHYIYLYLNSHVLCPCRHPLTQMHAAWFLFVFHASGFILSVTEVYRHLSRSSFSSSFSPFLTSQHLYCYGFTDSAGV